ncbi:MAG: PRC-barrel domain-containing protein [Hyphomicrobiales bacterium]|nr:PRC-barrel domain-containing protein [Hyphomicrobiales bacterium]
MQARSTRVLTACCVIVAAGAAAYGAFAQTPAPSPSPTAIDSGASKPGAATATPALVVNGSAAETLLAKPVVGEKGEDLGRIVDVIADRDGKVLAAIIDFGGFLGVGTRKIAVDWRALHFPADGHMDKLIADLSRDQLQTAPVYKPGEPVVIIQANAAPATPPPAAPAPTAPAQTAPSAAKP